MIYTTRHIKSLIFYLSIWTVLSFSGTLAQEATETPMPPEAQQESIFSNDTCAPPCWMGLIPGESTVEDVVGFFATFEQANFVTANENQQWLYKQEGTIPVIENGFYNFDFGPVQIPQCCGIYSRINIHEGIIYDVSILMLQIVTFGEAIERLGIPDEIHMGRYDYEPQSSPYTEFFFSFIYFDTRLRVGFTTDSSLQHPLICDYEGLVDNMIVNGARYYSPQAANELIEVYVGDIGGETVSQPALLAYLPEERHLPQEMWSMILGDEPTIFLACQDLWETLPHEKVVPELWNEEETESE